VWWGRTVERLQLLVCVPLDEMQQLLRGVLPPETLLSADEQAAPSPVELVNAQDLQTP
jgi:hypothetical protein